MPGRFASFLKGRPMRFSGQDPEQFRQLAAQFPNHEFREVISSLAATWENLADDRERLLPSRAADQHLAPTETVARITYAEPERDAEESRENKT